MLRSRKDGHRRTGGGYRKECFPGWRDHVCAKGTSGRLARQLVGMVLLSLCTEEADRVSPCALSRQGHSWIRVRLETHPVKCPMLMPSAFLAKDLCLNENCSASLLLSQHSPSLCIKHGGRWMWGKLSFQRRSGLHWLTTLVGLIHPYNHMGLADETNK